MRVQSEMQNVTTEDLVDYFMNPQASAVLKEVKTLETLADGGKIMYWRFSMPMMSDRDAVLHMVQQRRDDANGTFIKIKSVEHADMPLVKDIIRMYYYEALLLQQQGDNLLMTECIHMDMKGYMPASLMNMTIASETSKEFITMMNTIYER